MIDLPYDAEADVAEAAVLRDETVIKWIDGRQPVEVVFIKHRAINVVL